MKLGADPNERDVVQNNSTALIQASHGGYLETVKILLEAGADINAVDEFDQSALDKARFSHNQELIDYLEGKL